MPETIWEIAAVTADQFGQTVRVEFRSGGLPEIYSRAIGLLSPHQHKRVTQQLAQHPGYRRLLQLRKDIATVRAELAAEAPAAATPAQRSVLAQRQSHAERSLDALRVEAAAERRQVLEAAVNALRGPPYGLPAPLQQRQRALHEQVSTTLGPALEELAVLAAAERLAVAPVELRTVAESVLGLDEPAAAPPPTDFTFAGGATVPTSWVRPPVVRSQGEYHPV